MGAASFVIAGCGRMGTALAMALQSGGYEIRCGLARNGKSDSAIRFETLTRQPVVPFDDRRVQRLCVDVEALFITVPDAAILPTAQHLAKHLQLPTNTIVAHTAGAYSSGLLADFAALGNPTISMHPMQTIQDAADGVALLRGAMVTLQGDWQAIQRAGGWIKAWGGRSKSLSAPEKARYHAAAVLASNALVALAAHAVDVLPWENGLADLLPLMQGALANLEKHGLPNALTGPIERGDVETVTRHLEALEKCNDSRLLYRILGMTSIELAVHKGSLSTTVAGDLRALLSEP